MAKNVDLPASDPSTVVGNTTSSVVALKSRSPSIPSSLTLTSARQNLTRPFKRYSPQFPKFSLLPTEIRLQIWEAAIVARVHELHPCAKLYNDRMTFRSNSSQTPSIFHTCRESRQVALENYELMQYDAPLSSPSGKSILRFYFAPKLDTLLLNSLMGLFVMFMLLEDENDHTTIGMGEGMGVGGMGGWQKIAFDAERVQLIFLLSGISGHVNQPRFKTVFPSLKELTIAFDLTRKGKTRFRTSVWPGENGTTLREPGSAPFRIPGDDVISEYIFGPMRGVLESEYDGGERDVPMMKIAHVKRKRFIRGDIRYAFRKVCNKFGVRPRGVFRRI